MECYSCAANSGEKPIAPCPPVAEGQFWRLEVAASSSIKGWLVLALKRHAAALHELSAEEFIEFGKLLDKTTRVLHEVLGCEKEYITLFAEKPHFHHVHAHIVPKMADFPPELVGVGVMKALNAPPEQAISTAEVIELAGILRAKFAEM